MKKILTILLAVFCLAALPFSARGEEQDKKQQAISKARHSYYASLASAGKASFHGFCGLMTSHQLYHTGINNWCVVNDGNKQFDYYAALDRTTGGYFVTPYYLEDYSMEEALNQLCQNGKKDVYNILVGFQWTDSEAGSQYGHAVFINAILDGTVYFVEGFDSGTWGREGTVVQFTVEQFAQYYSGWCTYEGIVHFGGYMDTCEDHAADVFVRARFDTSVRSLPGIVGQEGCKNLRTVRSGELLHGEALLKNAKGDWFYRVQGGYISANAVAPTQVCGDSMVLNGFDLPEQIEEDSDPDLAGTVAGGQITAVTATVTDVRGDIVLRERVEDGNLESLNEPLCFDLLTPGWYRLEIEGEAYSSVLRGGEPQREYVRRLLSRTKFCVGNVGDAVLPALKGQTENGWIHKEGKWHFYRQGKALTGWLTDRGVRYCLDDSGAALTGWQDMEDGRRYFTDTGAMVTGWFTAEDGTYHLDKEGIMATGAVTVGDVERIFDEMGILQE